MKVGVPRRELDLQIDPVFVRFSHHDGVRVSAGTFVGVQRLNRYSVPELELSKLVVEIDVDLFGRRPEWRTVSRMNIFNAVYIYCMTF